MVVTSAHEVTCSSRAPRSRKLIVLGRRPSIRRRRSRAAAGSGCRRARRRPSAEPLPGRRAAPRGRSRRWARACGSRSNESSRWRPNDSMTPSIARASASGASSDRRTRRRVSSPPSPSVTSRRNSCRHGVASRLVHRLEQLLGPARERAGDAADPPVALEREHAVRRALGELGQRVLQERQGAGPVDDVGDHRGDERRLDRRARRDRPGRRSRARAPRATSA